MDENSQQSQPVQESSDKSAGSKTSQIVLVVIVALALIGGGIYFLSQKKEESPETTVVESQAPESTPSGSTSPSASTKPSPVKAITVTGTDYSFNPSKITVNKGDLVKLTFKNAGKAPHNLVIAALNVTTKTIQPGESDTIEFTPTEVGTFSFVCSVPGHKDRGMIGTLVVK